MVTLVSAEDKPAQAAYPKPFSRPPSMGNDYDTWRDAKGPDIGEKTVDINRLPSRVDNSTRPQFPPIYAQKGGACGQFTAIASIFTYEMNLLNDTHADTDATRFPADFTWNMINRANPTNGSEAYHGWETAKHIGIPTVKSFGYVHSDKIGQWPDGYQIWREAMEYRVTGYRYTPALTVSQINEARGWLFDRNQPGKTSVGGLLALDGRMGELEKVTKTIADGEHLAGEDVWINWGPTGYGHGITCVGYDDQVGFDVNGDGKITNDVDRNGDGKITLADWERGAFIVVNSWGKEWSNDGKIYLLYSAMTDPTWERGNYFGRIEVSRHIPQRTLKLKLACSNRAHLRMTIGISKDKNATAPEHTLAPQVLNAWPVFGNRNLVGDIPLAGPNDPNPLELGIDLTPLLDKLGADPKTDCRIFLNFHTANNANETTGVLHACAIRNYDTKGTFLSESTVEFQNGDFSKSSLTIETNLR